MSSNLNFKKTVSFAEMNLKQRLSTPAIVCTSATAIRELVNINAAMIVIKGGYDLLSSE